MSFRFLTDNDTSFRAVWAWAKQLVTDLNKMASSTVETPAGIFAQWAGAKAPEGWLLCDGGSYTVKDQPKLFLAIGYTFGGSDDTFNVPDFRNKLMIGAGSLVALGETAGVDEISLSVDNLPAHVHEVVDEGHTHVFTGTGHSHGVTDAGHSHGVTDPGHAHAGGAAAAGTTGAAGSVSDVTAQASTSTATTGITVNSAVTGVSVNSAVAGGTNQTAKTGISIQPTGGGAAFSVLNPVIGVNIIIKA